MSIGIDIGKYKIKIVELTSNGNNIEIQKMGSFDVFENIALVFTKHTKIFFIISLFIRLGTQILFIKYEYL